MSATEARLDQVEQVEKQIRWATWILRGGSVLALGLVSFGSYSVALWVGMPPAIAIAYPLVIDLAMLYITVFAVNGNLPDEADWPIRTRARRIRTFVWIVVALFNELHACMFVWDNAALPAEGPKRIVAYAVASIICVGPVVYYGYAYAIEALVKAWLLSRRSGIVIEAEETTETRQQEQSAADRASNERLALAKLKVEAKTNAPAPPRPAPQPRTPAGTAEAGVRPPNAKKELTPEQAALRESLPGVTVRQKTEAYLIDQYRSGNPVNGNQAAVALGSDPRTTREILKALDERGALKPALELARSGAE